MFPLPGGSLGESISCLSRLLAADCVTWLPAPSIFKASNCITLISALVVTSLTLEFLSPSHKDACNYHGLIQITQGNLPISRYLTSHICKDPFAMEGNPFAGLGDLHVDCFRGTVFCVLYQDMGLSALAPGKLVPLSPGVI